MNNQSSELLEKIRQQFDSTPYPRTPLEESPKNNLNLLYIHNLVTPNYLRNKKVTNSKDKLILDVGCGTGYTSLILAEANPGSKVIGIDLSVESVNLAKERLLHHKFTNAEFYAVDIENLDKLGVKFDYINCDEVLYLLPDISLGFKALKSVLKPDGIIRGNLHSYLERIDFYRAQEVFKMMGLMDGNPEEVEIGIVRETIEALKDTVKTKRNTWVSGAEPHKEWYLMNYLFQGDKGFTIPQLFSAFAAADLEFISMVNWWQWDLKSLFKEPNNLPIFLGMSLPEISIEEHLRLFELLNPIHRLLDFWCGHPQQTQPPLPIEQWQMSDWKKTIVHLHPQLRTSQVKEALHTCLTRLIPFDIDQFLCFRDAPIYIDSTFAACLLSVWENPQPLTSLVQLWQKLRPVNLTSLEPTSEAEAFSILTKALAGLENLGYVLLEHEADQ